MLDGSPWQEAGESHEPWGEACEVWSVPRRKNDGIGNSRELGSRHVYENCIKDDAVVPAGRQVEELV
jgi:hypothetical protein